MKMDMNVLLIGEESAGIQALKTLTRGAHNIVAVMASPEKQAGGAASVWGVAEHMGYPVWPAQRVKDPAFAHEVRTHKVDIILNVHSLYLIHGDVLKAARIGSFNLHPGPLPRYAGLNTVSWAIYRGETSYGVTLHQMVPEIDAGAVVYQTAFDISETDTALSVYSKCMREGLILVSRFLEIASRNPTLIPRTPQDLTRRAYYSAGPPEDGRINWSRPARKIVDYIRACDYYPFPSPWKYAYTYRNDQEIAIVKASLTGQACAVGPGVVGKVSGSGVTVACGDEWIHIHKVRVKEKYLDAVEALKPSDRLWDRTTPHKKKHEQERSEHVATGNTL